MDIFYEEDKELSHFRGATVVALNGACRATKVWLKKPDGHMGWLVTGEYFGKVFRIYLNPVEDGDLLHWTYVSPKTDLTDAALAEFMAILGKWGFKVRMHPDYNEEGRYSPSKKIHSSMRVDQWD